MKNLTVLAGEFNFMEVFEGWSNQVIAGFSIIALGGLVLVFALNIGNFFNENGDRKKGFINLILYIGLVSIVVAGATYIRTLKL